ncbi:hypothetical protein [Streptococcus pluranimalium]|nr:hypothetical protein [Streptococcus pluranimalium]
MAVAPVDKNGEADYSEVVIAYAGTNREDFKDMGTDIQSIGLGSDELKFFNVTADSQFSTALDFAKQVEKEVKRKNPNAVKIMWKMLSKPFMLDYKIINKQYCFIG